MSRVLIAWSGFFVLGLGLLAHPAWAGVPEQVQAGEMLGFTAEQAEAQRAWEKRFDAQLKASDLEVWLERMSSQPNHVGAPHNKANAEFILDQFQRWGWEARIETFHVLYPTPKEVSLELVEPTTYRARLHEPALEGDRTSSQTSDALPPYHAYGGEGDITAPLVYVNRGMPDDYDQLERFGVSVRGKIVLARYGGGWRGLKPKLAYEKGALGCIIYSDPADDGYALGDAWPKGGTRPAEGVQRGSVADMPVYPGDPLTPGVGATEQATRLTRAEASTLLRIPVLPISHADAQPLLAALEGPLAPASWRGALPLTYHIGPGPAKVHLVVRSNWDIKPIYNVIAMIRGSEAPDQWVLRGNHHDGWVFGAWDPLSADVALLAEAQALGALLKEGWRPKRTIVYASWDGEEPGLLGSTEWAEAHVEELQEKAVLYVNSDTNARGFLRTAGSHCLQRLVQQVTAGVRDPQTGVSVRERLRAKILAEDSGTEAAKRLAGAGSAPPIGALGSGSDYSPFLQHVGIPSVDIRYGGEDQDAGVYHSVYDSFDHYIRFGDPGMVYGVLLAQTIGRVVLRAADAGVLPWRFTDFAETVSEYGDQVHKLADSMRERTEWHNRLVKENVFQLAADPKEPYVAPEPWQAVPFLNFAPFDNALARLQRSAKEYDEACAAVCRDDSALEAGQRRRVNELLQGVEQCLLHAQGLPGRAWYRHMIYAPGLQTGYGVKTLPGVREAIEERRWEEADQFLAIVGGVLEAASERLDQAARLLRAAGQSNRGGQGEHGERDKKRAGASCDPIN